MKKILVLFASFFAALSFLNAQDFQAQMLRAERVKDTLLQQQILLQWEKANPNDAQLYLHYFDYYYLRAISYEEKLLDKKPEGNVKYYEVPDNEGNIVAYLVRSEPNKDLLDKAFEKINEGIKKFPDNLDLRLSYMSAVFECKDLSCFENEYNNLLMYSDKILGKWTGSNVVGKESFAYEALEINKMLLLYLNTDTITQKDVQYIEQFIRMCSRLEKSFPEFADNLAMMSYAYASIENYEMALQYAKKLATMDNAKVNADVIIAEIYTQSGDKPSAIAKWTLILNDAKSSKTEKELAKKRLEEIRNY